MRLFELMNVITPSGQVRRLTEQTVGQEVMSRIIRTSTVTSTPQEIEQLIQRVKSDPSF